jgi:uncharacterized protein YuzE
MTTTTSSSISGAIAAGSPVASTPGGRLLACGLALTLPALTPVVAADAFLSVRDNTGAVLGGLPLLDGDVARYDLASGAASIYLPESAFTSGSIDVNALHMRSDGTMVFSTLFSGEIGGVAFGDGDLVEYDPFNDVARILLSESLWTGGVSTDVNGVFVRGDGRLVLSHNNDVDTLGGLSFSDGDLVEYDPVSDVATLLVSEFTLFDDLDGDIDALHVLENGHYLLSFEDDESISGIAFRDGDVVEYDPFTDTASLYLAEDVFESVGLANDINAFSLAAVPGPGAVPLLGLAAIAARGRCRAARDRRGGGMVTGGAGRGGSAGPVAVCRSAGA